VFVARQFNLEAACRVSNRSRRRCSPSARLSARRDVHVRALIRDPITTSRPMASSTSRSTTARQKVEKTTAKLDAFGGAELALQLKDDAKVGEYRISAKQGDRAIVKTFRVEEYRVPTCAVTVATDAPLAIGGKTKLRDGELPARRAGSPAAKVTWKSRAPPTVRAGRVERLRVRSIDTVDERRLASARVGDARQRASSTARSLPVSVTPDHSSKAARCGTASMRGHRCRSSGLCRQADARRSSGGCLTSACGCRRFAC